MSIGPQGSPPTTSARTWRLAWVVWCVLAGVALVGSVMGLWWGSWAALVAVLVCAGMARAGADSDG